MAEQKKSAVASAVDVESGQGPASIPHWRLVVDQALVTPEVLNWKYEGSGTAEDPYVVKWIENDPRNPMGWSKKYKYCLSVTMALATLAVAFCSSAYSGALTSLVMEFGMSLEVATLGMSFFVLGFALGPLLWAPFSELYGRQILFILTFGAFTFFNAGSAGAQNTQSILILRFFAGSFGSSPLTNAGGVIADMFNAKDRGLCMSIFSLAPFMGPVLGPIVGGFLGETEGWRWIEGLMAIFSGALWILGTFCMPETYAPVLLKKRAAKLSQMTGKVYLSQAEIRSGPVSLKEALSTSLSRPWILLFKEPIVLLLTIYLGVIYGTLYMLFGAYPIVYQIERGWTAGIAGLPFIGIAIGMVGSVVYTIVFDDKRYRRNVEEHDGYAPPEARLPPCLLGGLILPLGLFWFAWTNYPSLPWAASVAAGIPFGFSMVLIFLSVMNYLIDSYTIFAASVLAANSVLRSVFGAAFPLFTKQMYANLGIHWASTVPAFLALACLPFPFLFYKYGGPIRMKCKYAAEADAFMKSLRESATVTTPSGASSSRGEEVEDEKEIETRSGSSRAGEQQDEEARFERIKTGHSATTHREVPQYEESPFEIDRVHTRESFRSHRSKTESLARKMSRK
ncbi:MFS multidrug transporter [Lasiodiplodia theobromae]|uniref:MFS multidrug transporter n=1 Tax=Lasiodiplodia theobromae TaxID=45133 RepID=UPI0015C3C66A|nr:MFS multidrug transporter [Lasiodiplodia theobromae]KAF4534232.1 MFS multidrug transporter [Lasiodiplodia theobromae]